MINGKVIVENKPAVNVQVYESSEFGTPIKRNGKFTTTRTNAKGEYSINIPKTDVFFITFKLVGTDGATLPTNKVPLNLILNSNQNLPEFEISTPPKQTTAPKNATKKINYWWLLLLIPIVYKISKKK
tara:strand:- start:93 stop:476 length:384 start_codon:yes stop_codon:yes gene_type:complete